MKLTIITVCLNAANTIEKTLKSIIGQSYKNIELIVFDGKSEDGTTDIIEKYKEHITYFKSAKDKGVYDAMNLALEKATGDYVLFFNAGDTFCDENVLKNAMEEISKNTDYDFVFGWSKDIDENRNCVKINKCENYKNKIFFANNNICHQAIFYKRCLFFDDKYDIENFKIYADWDFNARIRRCKKAKMLPLNFAICNFLIGGISTDMQNSKIFEAEKDLIRKKYFKEIYPFYKIDKFMLKTFKSIYLPIRSIFIK